MDKGERNVILNQSEQRIWEAVFAAYCAAQSIRFESKQSLISAAHGAANMVITELRNYADESNKYAPPDQQRLRGCPHEVQE